MKKTAVAIMLGMAGIGHATAQTAHSVIPMEVQMEDVTNILDIMGIHASRFDLTRFLDAPRQVEVFVREYKNNRKTGKEHTFQLGRNIHYLNDYPEDNREQLRQEHKLTAGQNQWDVIKELSIYIRHENRTDSTVHIRASSPNAGSSGFRFDLHPADGHNSYMYVARPFSVQTMEAADLMEIPLILYGSAWSAPGTTFYRFCGESEIDPEMKAEILTHIPHYYIIGVRLKKEK